MKRLLLLLVLLVFSFSSYAQDTVFTSPPNLPNNGQSGVTFEIESTQPLNIIGLLNVFSSGATTANVWMRVGGVQHTAGSAPNITAANGWTQVITNAALTGADNSSLIDLPFGGYKLALPANTPVGVFIEGNTRYMTGTAGNANILTDGTLSVKTGTNYGYGGAAPSPTFHPRLFVGAVIYELGVVGNCPPFTNFLIDSITLSDAKISWTPGTGNTSFFLEYGPAGFTPGNGTTITGTYPGSQPPIYLTGLSHTTTYDVYMGEICNSGADSVYFPAPQSFTTTPICPSPSGINVVSTTSLTATIGFSSNFTSFDVEWGPTGFLQGTGCSGTFTSTNNQITLTNAGAGSCSSPLSPNTTYHFYIRSNCTAAGNGNSPWEGPYSFTTLCAPFAAPYSNDFDSDPSNVIPNCWSAINHVVGTTKGAVLTYTAITPNSTPNHIRMYNGSGTFTANDTVMLVSPQFSDLTTSNRRVEFYAKASTAGTELVVGTLANYNDGGSFVAIDTIALTTTHAYYIVDLNAANGYNGTHEFVGLMHNHTATFRTIYIDDFKYNVLPSCIGSLPSTMGANVGATDALAYWSGGQGNYTNVEWGAAGYTPGTGSHIGSAYVTGADTSYLITGLTAQTTYDFYIRDTCTVGGMGNYIGPFTFTTACIAKIAPYSENFENHTLGFYQGVDNCWTMEHSTTLTTVTSGYTWELRNTSQTSSGTSTGASLDNTLAPTTGGKFFNADVSYGSGGTASLISPLVDVSGLTNPVLEYHLHRYGSIMGDFFVDVYNGSTWVNGVHSYTSPAGFNTSQTDAYKDTLVDLAPYVAANGTVRVRFRTVNNGCCAGDNSLDDINFIEGPSCTDPASLATIGITDSEAVLTWFDDPSAISYEVWYGPDGFYQGSQTVGGTKVTVNNDSLSLNNLPENTCFEFAVRKICAPGDTSEWIGAIDFCTLCSNQLNGTYTVGGAPGPNNFPTLDTVVQLLNACGISGPVTVNLNGGIHNAFALLDIIGSSATNTVTFNGSAAGDSIMGIGGAIELNGADYINFNDLFIKSNTGFTVWMYNDAHHISFDNCVIESNRTTTSSLNSVMIASGSPTSQSVSGLNAHHISVTNSTIAGGYYGISIYNVSSTSHVNGLTISNCEFEDIYYYGIRSYYNDSVQILNNHFEPFRGTSGYGMYIYYNDAVDIIGNEVEWVGTYSLYSYYTNNGGTGTSTIANNLLNSSGTYGIYMYSPNNLDFFHNTINGGTHGMYLAGSTASSFSNIDFRNNIFTANGTGRALWIATSPLSGFTLDYNLYYNFVGNEIAYHNGTAYTSLTAWQTAEPTFNANSVFGNPVYVSVNNDLRLLGSTANDVGDNTVGIFVDVDGDIRPAPGSTTVDIGADEFTPVSCPPIIAFNTINILDTSANISWTQSMGNPGNNFQIEYGVNLSAVGGGTQMMFTNDTVTLNGLTPNTTYCVFIREICSSTDTSLWVGPYCFKTACTSYPAPYIADFDMVPNNKTGELGNCWIGQEPSLKWTARSGQTSSSSTGPSGDATTGTGIYMYIETSSGSTGDSTILTSPLIDLTGQTNPRLQFSYHMYGATINKLKAQIKVGSGAWQNLVTITGQQHTSMTDPWKDTSIALTGATGIAQVRFIGFRGTSFTGDIAIDDVEIGDPLTCPNPTNFAVSSVTGTTANLSWTGTSLAQNYVIEYGSGNFTLGTGTQVTTTTTSITLSSLPQNNLAVQAYLKADCGAGDSSLWVGPLTIITPAIPCDDIEIYSTGKIDGQSTLFLGWAGNGGDGEVSTNQASSGTQSLHIYDSGPAGFSDIVAVFENSYTTGIHNVEFDFYIPSGKGGYYNILHSYTGAANVWAIEVYLDMSGSATVQQGTNGSGTIGTYSFNMGAWNTVQHIIDLTNDTAWIMINGANANIGWQFSLGSTNMGDRFNAINFYSAANAGQTPDIYFDDLCVSPYVPSLGCADPTTLAASNITCDDAVLSWTSSTSMASSIIVYGPAGFNPVTGGTTTTASTGTVGVSNLAPNTAYDFYVVDICGNGDTSNVVGPASFTTLGGPITADFTPSYGPATAVNRIVSFDASASVGADSYSWDFGDGGVANTTTPNTAHSYSLNGSYQVCLTITGACGTDTVCDSVVVEGISLTENYLARSLSVYPNPTSNLLNISFDAQGSMEASLRLRDLSGKLIMEVNEKVSGSEFKRTLDISNLAKGVYMLEVVNGDNKAVRKITKD